MTPERELRSGDSLQACSVGADDPDLERRVAGAGAGEEGELGSIWRPLRQVGRVLSDVVERPAGPEDGAFGALRVERREA